MDHENKRQLPSKGTDIYHRTPSAIFLPLSGWAINENLIKAVWNVLKPTSSETQHIFFHIFKLSHHFSWIFCDIPFIFTVMLGNY